MSEIKLSFSGVVKAIHLDRGLVVKGSSGKVTPALLVSYPSGWYLHPLPCECSVSLNGRTLVATARLRVGDLIQAGQGSVITVVSAVPASDSNSRLVAPNCEVSFSVGSTRATRPVSGSSYLIGSAVECDLRIIEAGVRPQHALLAYTDTSWHIHDLSGDGVARLSGDSAPSTVAVSEELVWLGPLELSLRCYPLDRIGAASATAKPMSAAIETPPERPTHPVSVVETQVPLLRPASTSTPDSVGGLQLVRWIQEVMPSRYYESKAAGTTTPSGGAWFPPSEPSAACRYYQGQLLKYPGDLRLMFSVADCMASLGYASLERLTLKEMTRYHPNDFSLMLRIAERVYADQNRSESPSTERRKDLFRAHRYAEMASTLRPASWEAKELLQRIAVELALAELDHQTVGEDKP